MITALVIVASSLSLKVSAQPVLTADSVTMGAGYANEIYYNMTGGVVLSSPRNAWDIAFRTNPFSSGILTNDGNGVVLYTYPKSDTTGWATLDTAGLSTWTPMYNDPKDWENGAFSRNALGHPDYGWGRYNDVTHNLTGDSLFVIKLNETTYLKIWIIRKYSAAATYTFRFASLDGTSQHDVTLDCMPYISEDYLGYSLTNNGLVEFQPAVADWDIVFTKYMSVQPDGTPYAVTGVLTNPENAIKRFHPVPLDFYDWVQNEWDSTRSGIGWNWKAYNGTTFTYDIVDSNVYFVRDHSNDVHKLVFTAFAGSSSGKILFDKGKTSSLAVNDQPAGISVSLFPNPASDHVRVTGGNLSTGTFITLTDLSGKTLRNLPVSGQAADLDLTGIAPGIYIVTVHSGSGTSVKKLIVSR